MVETPAKPRRWFRFSLRRLLLFVLVCAIAVGWPHIWRLVQFERMKSYAGQNLRKLSEPEAARFAAILGAVLGEGQPTEPNSRFRRLFSPTPWYVWQTAGDEPLTILFRVKLAMQHPGESRVRICIFSRFGQKLSDVDFSTGWRTVIQDVEWEPATQYGFFSVKITTSPTRNDVDFATQYYALIGHEFGLIRYIDGHGQELDSIYHNPSCVVGPPAPDRSEEEWAAALGSANRGEVLRSLAWLGCPHPGELAPDEHSLGALRFKDAAKAGRIRARTDVRATLRRFAAGADPWISQVAKAALNGPDKRRRP
jgi:hypothetical protein